MLTNFLTVLILVALVLLFVWLAWRAWHSRRAWLKWLGVLLSGLLALVFVLITAVVLFGFYKLNYAPYRYTASDVKVAMTPEQIAVGERYVNLCVGCHSSTGNPPLDGSEGNFLVGGPPLGSIYAPNLTPAGPLKEWSDGEIIRAFREGVDKEGKPLIAMPSRNLRSLSDADAEAIVAYLRYQPAVEREVPETNLNALGAVIVATGMFPTSAQPPITGPVAKPQLGTLANGEYLSATCRDCHGQDLAGMQPGLGPSGPNLTLMVPNWSEDAFIHFFNTGTTPSGDQATEEMPWQDYRKLFTDEELKDLFIYLHGLQPVTKQASQ